MRSLIRTTCIVILFGSFSIASAELPPEILVDKYLIHAEQLHDAKDYAAAFDVMQKIVALQKEHNLTVSDDFHFQYAQVALAADSTRLSLESVTRYLAATGKEGQHYQEALKVMLKAEGNEVISSEDFYNDVIKAQGTCEGLPEGSSCWMPLTNHPDCYVWNDHLSPGESVIWNGRCAGHVAEGEGTLTWYQIRQENGRETKQKGRESSGRLKNGKKEGRWVWEYTTRDEYGSTYGNFVVETYYAGGRIHGPSISKNRFAKRTDTYGDEYGTGLGAEDPYGVDVYLFVDGEETDKWGAVQDADWTIENEGPDVNGSGRLVYRSSNGDEWGGPYVNGKRHGRWVERWSNGEQVTIYEGVYVNGKQNGHWVVRSPDGEVWEGLRADGKNKGQWIGRNADGGVIASGTYVDGDRHGKWTAQIPNSFGRWLSSDGKVDPRFVGEGNYSSGEEHGQWLYHHPNGNILKVEFKDGYTQFPVFLYDSGEGKCWRITKEKKKKVKKENCLN